jgi:uncharacterized membrane protein YdjX (TVP38/TMEM64 family)
MKTNALLRQVALLALALAIGAALLFLPWQEELRRFLDGIKELGPWGPVLLGLVYIPATVFCVPGSLLTLGAGFAFGVVVGTIAISLGSTAGAAAAFLVGRFLARDWVEQKVAGHPKFRALDQAVAAQGFKIVLLTRLSPLFPFNVLNYAFGLTNVRFRDYVLASWIGMLPGTVMYVYLGSVAESVASLFAGRSEKTPEEWALYGVGLAATVAVTVYVTIIARRALAKALPQPPTE